MQIPDGKNVKQTWISLDEFIKLSGIDSEKVKEILEEGTIASKIENDTLYVEVGTSTQALIKKIEDKLVSIDEGNGSLDPIFVEKTIATILGLHEKVVVAKDETIAAFKNENAFLKEALISMQDIYDDDKKTIDVLRLELTKSQEEIEFIKRKYRLMWGKISDSKS